MPLHVEEAKILLSAQFDVIKLTLQGQPNTFVVATLGAFGSMMLDGLHDNDERRGAVKELVNAWMGQIRRAAFEEGDVNGKHSEDTQWRN